MIKQNIFYSFLLSFFVLISCDRDTKSSEITQPQDNHLNYILKTQKRNDRIIGQLFNFDGLDLIKPGNNEKQVIVVTMLSDCSGCRKKTYEIAQRIDKLLEKPASEVVGSNLELTRERLKNGLNELPYTEDENLMLKSALNLSHTPSILLISDGVITDLISLHPHPDVEGYDEEKAITDFISSAVFD